MYQIGDILRGMFPRSDHERGAHMAIVLRTIGPYYVALVGTSKKVGGGSVGKQLVIAPGEVPARTWKATGLVQPTGFDFYNGRLVIVGPAPGKYREELIGSIAQDPLWRLEMARRLPLIDERISDMVNARR